MNNKKSSQDIHCPNCESENKTTKKQWALSFLIVIALYFVFRIFNSFGILDWLDVDPTNINLGLAVLIGVAASLSTCLVTVGAVVISFGAKYKADGENKHIVKPHLLFHLGRYLSFFILGGILGLVGTVFNLTGNFMSWFTIFIAIILLWLGLNIIGLMPSLSKFGIRMPKTINRLWHKANSSDHLLAPLVLGALTFFLPCGFTQSMQLFAMTTASFWLGGSVLFLFALGTTPVLLGLGIASTKFSSRKSKVFQKALGIIVIIFALYTFSSGLALAGINVNILSNEGVKANNTADNMQTIAMTVDYSGYSPNIFELKKGIPVKWIIKGEQVTGCTNEIIVPELDIREPIKPGENIIEFTPTKVGTIGFSCWMGMIRGKFIVTDNGSSLSDAETTNEITSISQGTCNGSCGSLTCGAKTGQSCTCGAR